MTRCSSWQAARPWQCTPTMQLLTSYQPFLKTKHVNKAACKLQEKFVATPNVFLADCCKPGSLVLEGAMLQPSV